MYDAAVSPDIHRDSSRPAPARRRPLLRVRRGPGSLYRRAKSLEYLLTRDRRALVRFLMDPGLADTSLVARVDLVRRFLRITNAVRGYHTLAEMLVISGEILRRRKRPGLTVLEAGCGKGSSTAKLSLVTRCAGGRLLVYDSFRGIPDNAERHQHLDGRPVVFRAGAFRGNLASVRRTVARFGAPDICHFEKGLFADTLPRLPEDVRLDVVLLDVDLLSATRTCITELFPRLAPDGVMLSQDGQLRATHTLLADRRFWQDEVGVLPPVIEGLGQDKLLVMRPALSR